MSTASEQVQEFKVIGTRPVRHDGVEKVIGRAKYGADYSLPEMLWAKVLRSPHAHARIKSINIAKALKHPGVKAVITSFHGVVSWHRFMASSHPLARSIASEMRALGLSTIPS